MAGQYRVGVDIGGTFTDLVLVAPDGATVTHKLLTTPHAFGHAVVEGVRALLARVGVEPAAVSEVVHGTTVATNAVLEGQGAPTGLITTRGFRDVLEIRRIRSPELYNLLWDKPPPIVPRRHRLEVDERIDRWGTVERPVDLATTREAVTRLVGEGITSLAVCFLNSYANPVHERAVGELVRAEFPRLALSLSCEVLPEIREYERTSTTVINAFLMPTVQGYLAGLEADLRACGVVAPLLIMQSNGGVMAARAAQRRPVHIVESGPAAGVIAAAALARRLDLPNVLTFDMGGTTAKASIVEGGQLSQTGEYEVGGGVSATSRLIRGGGYALRVPVIDVAEVGAGGGSIVWVDRGGSLQVGPRSAGAVPGPACYPGGGAEPTVTDANVVLGYLNPEAICGGTVPIDAERAARALEERVAGPLGLALDAAAYGVHLVANASMQRALRAVSTQRGRDPRGYALFAFGGSGPIHAVGLARALEIERVIVPPAPGLFSAFGLLLAEVEHHSVRTCFRDARTLDLAELNALVGELEREALATLAEEGFAAERVALRRSADLRYAGQSFELTVPLEDGVLGRAEVEALVERFAQEHERTYGHRGTAEQPVDLVNLRLVAAGRAERARPGGAEAARAGAADAAYGEGMGRGETGAARGDAADATGGERVRRGTSPRATSLQGMAVSADGERAGLAAPGAGEREAPATRLPATRPGGVRPRWSSWPHGRAEDELLRRSSTRNEDALKGTTKNENSACANPGSADASPAPAAGEATYRAEGGHPSGEGVADRRRRAYFGPGHGWVETPVLARAELDGTPRPGPLIVEEYDTTVVVPPGCLASLDRLGNIVVEVRP